MKEQLAGLDSSISAYFTTCYLSANVLVLNQDEFALIQELVFTAYKGLLAADTLLDMKAYAHQLSDCLYLALSHLANMTYYGTIPMSRALRIRHCALDAIIESRNIESAMVNEQIKAAVSNNSGLELLRAQIASGLS